MPANPDNTTRSRWTSIVSGIAIVFVLLGAAGWWLVGQRVWTDDRTIRMPDAAVKVREILWTQPQSIDEAFRSEQAFNTEDDEYEPSLSPDGTEFYFVRGLPGERDEKQSDIYFSVRQNNRWSPPQPLPAINTKANELGPRLSHDGELLYFYSDREGGLGGYDLWASPRTETGWGPAVNLGPTINSPHNEFNPAPSPDGKRLFFATNRKAASAQPDTQRWNATIRHNPSATDYDIFVAMLETPDSNESSKDSPTDAPRALPIFAEAVEIPDLNTPFHEGSASVAPGGDFLYFASNRDGAERGYDLYRCRLRPITAPGVDAEDPRIVAGLLFDSIEKITQLNSPLDETDPAPALEGFRLLYSSNAKSGKGGYDLYLADSREVFVDRDARTMPALGWSWWVLLAAVALLLLLLFLFRKIDSEKLGLLQRCLIVSLFIHLIITIILSFFWLSKEVYEKVVEQEQEMRIALNLDAATEIDLRLSTRSQQADLPVTTPTLQDAPRQVLPTATAQATQPRQLDLDIPAASATPTAQSMVVPPTVKQQTSPANTQTSTTALPASAALPELVMPQLQPLNPVKQNESTPAPANVTSPQQATSQPESQPATSAPAPLTPSTAHTDSAVTAASSSRAQAAPAPLTNDSLAPAKAAEAPTPASSFDAARVTSAQPSAPTNADQQSSSPQAVTAATTSAAESAPTQAPPSQAKPHSLVATSEPTRTAVSQTQSQAPTIGQTLPSAAPVATPQMESKPVASTKPDGVRVTEATTNIAQRAATAPASTAGEVKLDAPPTTPSSAQAAQNQSAPSSAKSIAVATPSPSLSLPTSAPEIGTQPASTARITAADVPVTTGSATQPQQTSTQRVTSKAPETQAAAQASAVPAAPTTKAGTSTAATAATPTRESAKANRMTEPAALALAEPVTPSIADASPNQSSPKSAAPTSLNPASDAGQAVAKQQAASQNTHAITDTTTPNAAAPSTTGVASNVNTPTDSSRATAAAVSQSPSSLAPAEIPLDIVTPSFTSAKPRSASGTDLSAKEQDARDSVASRSTAADETSRGLAAMAVVPDVGSPSDSNARSIVGRAAESDLRARAGTVVKGDATELALQPLNEPLGPGKFAALAPLFQRAPQVRDKLLEKLGGTPESEDAVGRALAYLSRNQEPDGRWTFVKPGDRGPGKRDKYLHDTALTALSVLAFLGSDHTPHKPGPYRDHVQKGLDYLLKRISKDGDARGDGNMYDQGIVAIALAEAALMTGDARLREAALSAARFITGAQDGNSGGWRYQPGEYGDTSVLGWQIMALHSAQQLGFDFDKRIITGTEKWLDRVTQPKSLVSGYQQEGPRPSMTAEAVFTRILIGQKFDTKQIKTFEDYMFDNPAGKGEADYYYLYYATLSFNQLQGKSWSKWNEKTRQYIIKKQNRDGADDGSWDMVNRWDRKGGQIYTTCMAALTLEVYYRYLPMYGGNVTPKE